MIYLDSAATTLQKPPSVARAVAWGVAHLASPGRGGHRPAMASARTAFACRELAAELFHVPDPEQVVLTFNATHGLNLAIHALVKPGSRIVISGYEHNAVTRPLSAIPGVAVAVAKSALFDREGTLCAFRRALEEETDVVICTHVSNVFGFILPLEEIAALCREKGVPLIVDASQSAGVLPIDFQALGARFVAMPGHKGLFGPQGTGLLLCGGEVEPLLYGGTGSESLRQTMPDFLPDRLEAGTHNMAGVAGLVAGMSYVKGHMASIAAWEGRLLRRLGGGLSRLPGAEVFWSEAGGQTGVLSFRLKGWDCEELGEALGDRGFALRAGFHCAPLAHQSAGTLDTGTVRASLSPFNGEKEIDRLLWVLAGLNRKNS